MSVETLITKVQYAADPSVFSLPFTFCVFDEDEIKVIVTSALGVETVLTYEDDYTVLLTNIDYGTGEIGEMPSPGSVELVAGIAAGNTITITTNLPYTQEIAFANTGVWSGDSINEGLDRNLILIQQLKEMLSRSLLLKLTSAYSNLVLPDPESEKVMRWKSDLSGLENADIPDLTVIVSDFVKTLLDDETATAFLNTLGLATFQAFLNYLRGGAVALSDSTGTITFDCSLAGGFYTTLSGTDRILVMNNITEGVYRFLIIQGAGGNKTITTWPTMTWLGGGTAPVLSTAAGKADVVTFWYANGVLYGSFAGA